MKTLLIEADKEFLSGMCRICPIFCCKNWEQYDQFPACPLANAKEVVEVKESQSIEQWEKHHLKGNTWVAHTEVDGKPVKLWATEDK